MDGSEVYNNGITVTNSNQITVDLMSEVEWVGNKMVFFWDLNTAVLQNLMYRT